jgi:hypothetical protein
MKQNVMAGRGLTEQFCLKTMEWSIPMIIEKTEPR